MSGTVVKACQIGEHDVESVLATRIKLLLEVLLNSPVNCLRTLPYV